MSNVLKRLLASDDPVEREMASTLLEWQKAKVAEGRKPVLGYEPRDINRLGAVATISRRVLKSAKGFDEVGATYSYEAIVDRFPDRFSQEVVQVARRRLRK